MQALQRKRMRSAIDAVSSLPEEMNGVRDGRPSYG